MWQLRGRCRTRLVGSDHQRSAGADLSTMSGEPSGVRVMATKDTGGGQQKATRSTEEVEEQAPEAQASEDLKERQEKLSDDVDSVLDEIDDVLEENAEDFVRVIRSEGWASKAFDIRSRRWARDWRVTRSVKRCSRCKRVQAASSLRAEQSRCVTVCRRTAGSAAAEYHQAAPGGQGQDGAAEGGRAARATSSAGAAARSSRTASGTATRPPPTAWRRCCKACRAVKGRRGPSEAQVRPHRSRARRDGRLARGHLRASA